MNHSQAAMLEQPLFAPDVSPEQPEEQPGAPWKVLVVDDDVFVHEVTRLALEDFKFDRRKLEFLHAYSGKEAETMLTAHDDVAIALVDVVMETDHAGLDLVRHIRGQLSNRLIRLILRTGQPGQAPETQVIHDYDINDYKEKGELTAQKLYTTVLSSLRSYRDLAALEANRRGLVQVIKASGEIFRIAGLNALIQGVLAQLVALLYLDEDSLVLGRDSIAVESVNNRLKVLAGTGKFAEFAGSDARQCLPQEVLATVDEAFANRSAVTRKREYAAYFSPGSGHEDVIYVSSANSLTKDNCDLLKLFLQNAAIACERTWLREEVDGAQRDIVCLLSEAIETRRPNGSRHVARVAEYCAVIGRGLGLSERDIEALRLASPLHDIGKIVVPEAILAKPGKLDAAEWRLTQTHAASGAQLLQQSNHPILKIAADIAGYHHERWDGKGYPRELAGDAIPLCARIAALADAFSALCSDRSYRAAWTFDQIFAHLQAERGGQFDPRIVDWALANREAMIAVASRHADG